MKKRILYLMGMALLLLAMGCGGKTSSTTSETTTPAPNESNAGNASEGEPEDVMPDPTGVYELSNEVGTHATLTVKKEGDGYGYKVDAGVGNAAEMERSGKLTWVSGGEFDDEDGACHLVFMFVPKACGVSYIGSPDPCGEIDLTGTYNMK